MILKNKQAQKMAADFPEIRGFLLDKRVRNGDNEAYIFRKE